MSLDNQLDYISIKNIFGIASPRNASSGWIEQPNQSRVRNSDSSVLNLHVGPCLISWQQDISHESPSIDFLGQYTNQSHGSQKNGLSSPMSRKQLKRLHHDAVTHLLPLSNNFTPNTTHLSSDYWIVSSSYLGEVKLWHSKHQFEKCSMRWNVNSLYENHSNIHLPVNSAAWNPQDNLLAVVSGPKNASLTAPTNDNVSPKLPMHHLISIWNMDFLRGYHDPSQPSSTFTQVKSQNTRETSNVPESSFPIDFAQKQPSLHASIEYSANGDVLLAWCKPRDSPNVLLACAFADMRRDHRIILFSKDLSIETAYEYSLPGGSITYFSATPDGSALVLLKSGTCYLFEPSYESCDSLHLDSRDLPRPSLKLVYSQVLSHQECSPFCWIPNSQNARFFTTDSNGTLFLFEIGSDSFIELDRVQTNSSGGACNLIWKPSKIEILKDQIKNDEKEQTNDEMDRVSMDRISLDRIEDCSLWSVGMFGLNGIRIMREKSLHESNKTSDRILSSFQMKLHGLTCCGIDFDPSGQYLAIGDWNGLVSVWKSDSTHFEPDVIFRLPHSMIRAIKWSSEPNIDGSLSLMVGDTSGKLFECRLQILPNLVAHPPQKISDTHRTITCMQWLPNHISKYGGSVFAMGDSDGMLRLFFKQSPTSKLKSFCKFQAHLQMPHVTSHEIWTLCFSPDGRYIATGSEDYTVHVYEMSDSAQSDSGPLKQVAVLKGCVAAVTCIDWKITPLGTIFIAASDDRTIHCWKDLGRGEFELIHIFRTNWDHLMITYASLEPLGTRIVCGTMSGFVYVFDLNDPGMRIKCKTHLGSIEGLAWNHVDSKLAVCSSDCTATLFELRK